MSKEQIIKAVHTFLEIYKTFGDKVAWSWLNGEIDKLTQKN
jgi:hypothetical protein